MHDHKCCYSNALKVSTLKKSQNLLKFACLQNRPHGEVHFAFPRIRCLSDVKQRVYSVPGAQIVERGSG